MIPVEKINAFGNIPNTLNQEWGVSSRLNGSNYKEESMDIKKFRGGFFSVILAPSLCVFAAMASFRICAEDYVVTVAENGEDVVWRDVSEAGPAGLLAGDERDRRLVKMGKGRLIIECDLKGSGYAGEIYIQEGYLRLRHDGACGTSAGGVTVKSGATLEGDPSYKSGGLAFNNEPLTFGGFGVDGVEGAVKMLSASPTTWNFFTSGKKTMTDDSLWVGLTRLDVRKGEFDMGGHTLFTSNSVAIVGQLNVSRPGKIVHLPCDGSLVLESSADLNGGATNELVLVGGAMEWKKFSVPVDWSLVVSNNSSVRATIDPALSRTNLASALMFNRWNGPVRIAEGGKLLATVGWISASTSGLDPFHHILQIFGRIEGDGSLEVAENGYLRMGCPTNSFAGGVVLRKNALVEAASVGSLGSRGIVSMNETANVEFLYGELYEPLLTDEEYKRILAFKNVMHEGKNYYSAGSNLKFIGLPDYFYRTVVDASEIPTIHHNETNTLTLTKGVSGVPKVINTGGTFVLGGEGDFSVGDIRLRDGTLRIADGSRYHMDEHAFCVHGTYPMAPRFVVGDGSVLSSRDDATQTMLPVSYIAGGLSGDNLREYVRGAMEILPGATVSNILIVGGAELTSSGNITVKTNYMGAVYMRGGRLVQQGNNARDEFVVGYNANGYFEMTDGFLDASKRSIWISVGSRSNIYDTPGYGVMHVKGGRIEHRSVGFGINSGGAYGHMRVSSGVVSNDTLIIGKSAWTGKSGGCGTFTVDGDAEVSVKGNAYLGGISNSVTIVNLNGGVFCPHSLLVPTNLCQTSGAGSQFCEFLEGANNPVYVNFNGGKYCPAIEWSDRNWLTDRVTRYTVFSGGVVVDTGTTPRKLHKPILAPAGNGVKSIPFYCNEPWRYIGSPYVKIVDPSGNGYGATAFADFDSANGTVTGITVTSPGCDYGEGTYAEIAFGGWTNVVRVAVEVATNDLSGGFAKYGSGSLDVICTNGWRGVTSVKEGTLNLAVENALPETSGYDIAAGATVSFCGLPQHCGTLSGAGTLVGDYALSGSLSVDAADIIAGRGLTVQGSVDIALGTRFVVKNADLLTEKFVNRPVLKVVNGTINGDLVFDASTLPMLCTLRRTSSELRFGPVYGTAIVIR